MSDKPYLLDGHMYQYDLGWMIHQILQFKNDLDTAIDLKTIHYADPIDWDITTQYAPNTVVVDPKSGTAYMSKQAVPQGILLTNTDYWLPIFNYQAELTPIMQGTALSVETGTTATKAYLVNDLLWYKSVLYRVTRPLAVGDDLTPNYNIVATSVESLLARYYGRDRVAQVENDTINVSGDYVLHAGNVSQTADNITLHSTTNTMIDADGKYTEQITGNREIDVDGSDSLHVNGETTINRGGAVTEVYGSSVDKTVNGTHTDVYSDTATTTYSGQRLIHGQGCRVDIKDLKMSLKTNTLPIIFPDKTIDLHDIDESVKGITTIYDYGAVGDGIADDTAAFEAAAQSGDTILVPNGSYKCTKNVTTDLDVNTTFILDTKVIFVNAVPFEYNGAGSIAKTFFIKKNPTNGYADTTVGIYDTRGGTRGKVYANKFNHAIIRKPNDSYIWADVNVVSIGDNIVNAAENCAGYSQINGSKTSDTGMWGHCVELNDPRADPAATKTGIEITMRNGESDKHGARHALHMSAIVSPGTSGSQIDSFILASGNNDPTTVMVGANSLIRLEGVNYQTLLTGPRPGKQRPKIGIALDFSNLPCTHAAIRFLSNVCQFDKIRLRESNGALHIQGGSHDIAIDGELNTGTFTQSNVALKILVDSQPYYIPLYTV